MFARQNSQPAYKKRGGKQSVVTFSTHLFSNMIISLQSVSLFFNSLRQVYLLLI